ncbi:MAG: hypothetical protein LH481_03790, partial [Burkholderiales bacterium]|nr:hypothetical protein [Burkholderiales bacterium]
PVQAIAAGSNVSAMAAGYGNTCAVVNGGVVCWGDNTYGQLANNYAPGSEWAPGPVLIMSTVISRTVSVAPIVDFLLD